MSRIVLAIDIDAPAARVFDAVVDWRGQDQWIPFTTVRAGKQAGIAVGGEIAAYTGLGGLGFLDTMTITRWDVPRRVDVLHTGMIVRGIGIMAVRPIDENSSRFYWAEDLEIPGGVVGALGWHLVKPAFRFGVAQSLKSFKKLVEAGQLGVEVSTLVAQSAVTPAESGAAEAN